MRGTIFRGLRALVPRQHVGDGLRPHERQGAGVDGRVDDVLVDDRLVAVLAEVAVAEEGVDPYDALLASVRNTAPVPLDDAEIEFVEGYSRPGKLVEVEITARR